MTIDTSPIELPRTCVITIQGGGAVAIDLVGQLQGLIGPQISEEGKITGDQGLLPAAVAGTSAGALIATLHWARYKPEAIRDIIVSLFEQGQIDDFFGYCGVWPFKLKFSEFVAVSHSVTAALKGWRSFLWHIIWPGCSRIYLLPVWWAWKIVSTIIRAVTILVSIAMRRGAFSGEGMTRAIDDLLRRSPLLAPYADRLPKGGLLLFGDVAALSCDAIPLFLVTTNVRQANFKLVSSIDPANYRLEIAKVARASAGFPGFFEPIDLGGAEDCCVDGGVVSNYPAWVFSQSYRRRLIQIGHQTANRDLVNLAYLPWLHVGLRLPAGREPDPRNFNGFVRGLAGLLAGRARGRLDDMLGQAVPKRCAVDPTDPATDEAPANVLDFTALSNKDLVQAAYSRGCSNGQQAILAKAPFALPANDEIKPLLVNLAEVSAFLLRPWLHPNTKIRTNVFLRQRGELVLVYQANMDGDPDEHIRFSFDQGISSLVMRRRVTVVADLSRRVAAFAARNSERSRDNFLERPDAPVILGDRTWLISMPLIDVAEMWPNLVGNPTVPFRLDMDGPVLGVLNVDCSMDCSLPGAPTPEAAAGHPAIKALFDAMKSTALQCSMAMNHRFLQ